MGLVSGFLSDFMTWLQRFSPILPLLRSNTDAGDQVWLTVGVPVHHPTGVELGWGQGSVQAGKPFLYGAGLCHVETRKGQTFVS